MSDQVVISLISGITSVMVAIITVVIKTWLDARKEAKKLAEESFIEPEALGEMIYVQEFIETIREEYDFDRVSICQFHNGGKFYNGRSMKKFSMTYESTAPGIEKIKRVYQNVLVSEFPKMVASLVEKEFFIINEEDNDLVCMKRDMAQHGIVQIVKVPIRGLRGDLMGFLTCHCVGTKNDLVNDTIRHEFVDKANQISGYLL
jgi:hypothetical protein